MGNEDKGTEKKEETSVAEDMQGVTPFPAHSGLDEKFEFILPIGSFDLSNRYYRKVNLGQLTGKIRKKIGRPDILNHPGKLVTAILFELIEFPEFEFTDEKREKKVMIRSMYSADRSACILAIRKATKKNAPIIQEMKCPACPSSLQIQTLPDELETFKMEETEYKLEEKQTDVRLTVKAGGGEEDGVKEDEYVGIFTLSRGFDEEGMTREQMKNVGEYTYAIVAACTVSVNGHKVDEDFYTNRCPIIISDKLIEQFLDNQPGPDTFKTVQCTECDASISYGVDPSDFILPSSRRNRLRKFGRK